MRPHPSSSLPEGVGGGEEDKGGGGGGRRKRRRLGWVIESSRTVLESDFWSRLNHQVPAANAQGGAGTGRRAVELLLGDRAEKSAPLDVELSGGG